MTDLLLAESWLFDLANYEYLYVGFSGGLDSTVLLYNLAKQVALFSKIIAVHVNHGLSPNAIVWQNHCEEFCRQLKLPFLIKQVIVNKKLGLEQAARVARYEAFSSLLKQQDGLILGHHLDDQAETVFLQLFRGAGVEGLAAMKTKVQFARGQLIRPLLTCTRQKLHSYAKLHQLKWIEDESNEDTAFSRNYLRHEIIPQLKKQWPSVSHNLARAARHCRQAQANLEALAKIDCPALSNNPENLDLSYITKLEVSRLSNCLRVWLRLGEVRLPSAATFERILNELVYARKDAEAEVCWDDVSLRRYQGSLYLIRGLVKNCPLNLDWNNFPESISLGEGRGHLTATPVKQGLMIPANSKIAVKYRRGGELIYWHGQTKKLKKLFQEWRIPPWLRDTIPLLYINNQLVAIVGYAINDRFYESNVQNVYEIKPELIYS